MDIFLIRLLQFMLAIGLLVLLHEGGHFFFAKLFGVKVDKFYLFFDPSIWKWDGSLFKWKPKNSDTQYGVGWLPLGGYCKIAGMIDESFDTEQMKQPEQPWEFRAKPAWQRLLIMIGGVLVNFLLALFIYSMILFHWGDTYIPVKDMTLGMKFNAEAKALGFQDGDILVGTEKGEFKEFSADLYRDLSEATRADIIRNGKAMSLQLPGDLNLLGMLKAEPSFVRPLIPAEIDSVMADTPAASIGLQKGDKIIALNGKPIDFLALHKRIETSFVAEIKYGYEWLSLWRILYDLSLLEDTTLTACADQMNKWYPNAKKPCCADSMGDYFNPYLGTTAFAQWDEEEFKKRKTSKQSISGFRRLYNDCETIKEALKSLFK